MHFGFALELSNVDLLDTHLDLLDTNIPSKYFACLNNVFKTSSRHVFKTSSKHVFKTSSRHVFKTSSRHVFKTSSRRPQRNNFSSSKTSSRRLQDVFARCLQDVLEDVKLLRWRSVEDVFNKRLLGRVFKWQENVNVIVISALSSTKSCLSFLNFYFLAKDIWGNVHYVSEINLIS